jgi:hypothetical protein
VLAQHGRAAGAAKGTRISSTRGERGGHAKATPSRMSPQRTSSGQRP